MKRLCRVKFAPHALKFCHRKQISSLLLYSRKKSTIHSFLTTFEKAMCLAIPGKIISLFNENNSLQRTARVDFSGISKEINLSFLPEAKINDYVIVHAGLALSILDEEEAQATLAAFAALDVSETR